MFFKFPSDHRRKDLFLSHQNVITGQKESFYCKNVLYPRVLKPKNAEIFSHFYSLLFYDVYDFDDRKRGVEELTVDGNISTVYNIYRLTLFLNVFLRRLCSRKYKTTAAHLLSFLGFFCPFDFP